MTKRTTINRPQVGARYSIDNCMRTRREVVAVIEIDARYVYALDADKHPLRWTRAVWRRDKPERIG